MKNEILNLQTIKLNLKKNTHITLYKYLFDLLKIRICVSKHESINIIFK